MVMNRGMTRDQQKAMFAKQGRGARLLARVGLRVRSKEEIEKLSIMKQEQRKKLLQMQTERLEKQAKIVQEKEQAVVKEKKETEDLKARQAKARAILRKGTLNGKLTTPEAKARFKKLAKRLTR